MKTLGAMKITGSLVTIKKCRGGHASALHMMKGGVRKCNVCSHVKC
jgi:hypothetical protein